MRIGITTFIASIVVCAMTGVACASSHGAMPADATLYQAIIWQLEDFAAHLSLTFDAIKFMFVSPSLGWAMLDGALCEDKTHWAHALFDTADHALESFTATVLILGWVGVEVASRVLQFLFRTIRRRARTVA